MTRLGPGYGKKIRKKVNEIEKKSSKKYKCPSCSRIAVKRVSPGVWQCKKCQKKYASGTYTFNVRS